MSTGSDLNSLLMWRRASEAHSWLVKRWPSESTVPRLIPAGGELPNYFWKAVKNASHLPTIHGT